MSDRPLYVEPMHESRIERSGQEWARSNGQPNVAEQTLGDALLLSISAHGHTIPDAAALMGTARANVEHWTKDLIDPWPEDYEALMAYLDVQIDTLGVLIIYSHLRRAGLRTQRTLKERDVSRK
jgi:hypothetical protein